MIQELKTVIAVSFSCPSTIEEGDVVEITGDNEVDAISGANSLKVVGSVCAHRYKDTTCTVSTRFLARRDNREAGEDVAVGPFVFGSGSKVHAYDPENHSPAAICGLVIRGGAGGDPVETLELV